MKLSKLTLSLSLVAFSATALAATAIAPANRLEAWIGSNAMPDSNYTIGTTTAMGVIKTLKANLLTQMNLASLDMTRYPGAYLSTTTTFNGGNHQRLSDNGGTPGQCVAFARSMTGASASTSWYQGNKVSDYLDANGRPRTDKKITPGTMIAHFGGKPIYSQNNATPHVAIFLSWSTNAQGIVDGVNVVDENLVELVSINGRNVGGANGLIQKHKLAWTCNAGTSCGTVTSTAASAYHITFFGSNYHVVDVR